MPHDITVAECSPYRAQLPISEAALAIEPECDNVVVARGVEALLCEVLSRRAAPAVVVLTGNAVPTASQIERLLATGGVSGIACLWLPDEAERLLGADAWRLLRPFYHWLPPLVLPGGGAQSRGVCWLRDDPLAGIDEIVRLALENVSGRPPIIVVWPTDLTRTDGNVCVVENSDAGALAWAVDGAGSRWTSVVDFCGRLSPVRAWLAENVANFSGARGPAANLRAKWAPVAAALAQADHRHGFAVTATAWLSGLKSPCGDMPVARLSWQVRAGLRPFDPATLGDSLLDGWCDGYIHSWRRPWVERLWCDAEAGRVSLAPDCACALALALGHDAAAETHWRRCENLNVRRSALWRIVRQRLPWINCGSAKPAASVWEKPVRWAGEVHAASREAGDVVLVGYVLLTGGRADEALAYCRDANVPSGAACWSLLAVQMWAGGWVEQAVEAAERGAGQEAEDRGGRFVQAVARAMCRADDYKGKRLEEFASEGDFFIPTAPAHTRCQFLALGLAALGRIEAVEWWERALREDPSAGARTDAWQRACQQGGLAS